MKLPQLSLPWAILASVVFVVLGALVFAGKVSGRELAMFVGGVVIPMWRAQPGGSIQEADPKPPTVPPLPVLFLIAIPALFAFSLTMLVACGASALPNAEYKAQKKACVDTSNSRAELETCWQDVENKWNEAGAPPAALDGGAR